MANRLADLERKEVSFGTSTNRLADLVKPETRQEVGVPMQFEAADEPSFLYKIVDFLGPFPIPEAPRIRYTASQIRDYFKYGLYKKDVPQAIGAAKKGAPAGFVGLGKMPFQFGQMMAEVEPSVRMTPKLVTEEHQKKAAEQAKKVNEQINDYINTRWPLNETLNYNETPLARLVQSTTRGALPSMTVAIGASILTGSPWPGLLVLGATETGGAYERQRGYGETPGRAAFKAFVSGGIEVATERIPFDFLLKGRIVVGPAMEALQEKLAGLGQGYIDEYSRLTIQEGIEPIEASRRAIEFARKQSNEDALVGATVGLLGAGAVATGRVVTKERAERLPGAEQVREDLIQDYLAKAEKEGIRKPTPTEAIPAPEPTPTGRKAEIAPTAKPEAVGVAPEEVFIHETDVEFDKFDLTKARTGQGEQWYGEGIYLTKKEGFKLERYGAKKVEATLKPDTKIFSGDIVEYATNKGLIDDIIEMRKKEGLSLDNITPRDVFKANVIATKKGFKNRVVEALKADGYDGYLLGDELVVYNPEKLQIAKPPTVAKAEPTKETLEKFLNKRIEEYLEPRRTRQKEIESILTEKDERRIQDIRQNPRAGQKTLVDEYNRLGKEIQKAGTREFEVKLQKEFKEAEPAKVEGKITVRKAKEEVFDEDYWLNVGYTKPTAKSMSILQDAIESSQGHPGVGGLYPWSVILTPEASKKLGIGFRYDAIKKGSTVLGVQPENFDKLRKQGYRIKEVQERQEIITNATELHKIAKQWEKLKAEEVKPKGKRVISEESYQKAKKRLTDPTKLRMGVDPQGFADLVTIGAYHVENGLRTFAAWSKKMIEVYGEKVRPQLKKVWAQVRPITMEEFNAFPGEFLSEQQRTKAEMGEIPSEGEFKSQSGSFNEHLDYFQKRQLPKTSKIPAIQARIRTINGQRLAGKVSAKAANKAIIALRKHLIETAIDESVALRMTRGGKVSLSVRKAGTYVPEEFAQYGKFKNIRPILGGGQDITRAIQQMDGSLSIKEKLREKGQAGPLERHVLWPTRDISLQKLKYIKEKTAELKSIFKTKKGTKEDEQVNLVLEKIAKEDRDTPIKDIFSRESLKSIANPRVLRQAVQLREFYDNLIEEQNLAREMRDQDTIPYRHNYSPHILRDTTIWERLMMTGKEPKDIKADLPDYIKPNAPFNPRAMAREAGIPYEERVKSAQTLAESYLVTAAKDIFNTSIVQNNKAFIQQLEAQGYDKSANYLADWTAEAYAGVKPRLDRAIQIGRKAEKSARYFNRLRNMAVFPLNFSWSLLTQTSSLALTVGRYGTTNTMRGFVQWLNPKVRKQAAEDYYSYVVKSERQGRITRQDAQNLIGQNVKLRRTSTEIARDISTLLLDQLEKLLTGTSIRAAYLHGEKRGLTGEALKNYASDGGAKTQSMYNDEDKPALLRNLLVKTGAPYQTFSYEVVNTMREWAGRTGTPPDSKLYTIWTVTRFLAAATVFAAIGKKLGKKEIWSWKRPPIPFAEFWLNPIVRILSNQWIGSASGLTSPVETAQRVAKGIDDVLETGSWRKLRNELIKYGPGIFGIPGGVQISRTVDALIAYAQGGVKDRRGKLLFKMEDPQDLVQAIFSGVWSTKGGREYLEPEYKWQQMSISELQKELRKNIYKTTTRRKDGTIARAGQPHRGSEKKVEMMKEILAKKKK